MTDDEAMDVALQPLLGDATVVLSAPTQAWSDESGEMGDAAIHGIYHGDTRVLRGAKLQVGGRTPETVSCQKAGARAVTFVSLARNLDDSSADPRLRIDRRREVEDGVVSEHVAVSSALAEDVTVPVRLTLRPDASVMADVKAGIGGAAAQLQGPGWQAGPVRVELDAPGATVTAQKSDIELGWHLSVAAGERVELFWELRMTDDFPVVTGASGPNPWADVAVESGDSRVRHWTNAALADLDALRMSVVSLPDEEFLAAGAPWFFTLFGRDSIWAARFLLPFGTELAGSTLRVLAAMQGQRTVPDTAEQPGKIMHELRAGTLEIPGEGVALPPLYYGTIDATPLWINLLHGAWRWGMPESEIRELLPTLERALAWLRDEGDSDGDGFLEYIDTSGHGLANQGWKDSGDSVQWKDGSLAEGPIALCEVQGYAYEAAVGGAELLDAFGVPGGDEWRDWAAKLKRRFAESFWVDDDEGRYPGIALDAHKRPVDTVTSNIGHLLGTGILSDGDAKAIAARLASPRLDSGYGLRTMSSDSAGFWPLSYHGGTVWAHDTAIVAAGLAREGFDVEAGSLVEGLLAAAEAFDYRMPELHSGDSRAEASAPVPYPAACRPQAWSAAAAVSVLSTLLGLQPRGEMVEVKPLASSSGALTVHGVRIAGRAVTVRAGD